MQSNQDQSKLDIKAKKALKKSAKHFYNQGKSLFAKGEFAQALNRLELACALDPSYFPLFETNYYLALACEHSRKTQMTDIQKTFDYADKALQILKISDSRRGADSKKVAELCAARARAHHELLKRKEYSPEQREQELILAAHYYADAALYGKRPEYYMELARIQLMQKKPLQVLNSLIKALEFDPKDQAAINFLNGFLLTWDACSTKNSAQPISNDIYAAIQTLSKEDQFTVLDTIFSAICVLPKEKQFTLLRKFLHPLENGRFRESLPAAENHSCTRQKCLERVWEYLIEIDPDKPLSPFKTKKEKYQYYFERGKTHLKNKEFTQAIRAFEIAFMYPEKQKRDVDDDDMYYYLASAYAAEQDALPIKERDYKIARDYVERIEFPKEPSRVYRLGYILSRNIYYQTAITNEAKGTNLEENPVLYQKALKACDIIVNLATRNAVSHAVNAVSHAVALSNRARVHARMKNPVKVFEDLLAAHAAACEHTDYRPDFRQKIENDLNDYLLELDETTLHLISFEQLTAALRILPKNDKLRFVRKVLYDLQSPLAKWLRKSLDATVIKTHYDELKTLGPAVSGMFVNAPVLEEASATFEQYMQFGKAFYNEKKYEEAMQCFNKAISLKDDNTLNKEDRKKAGEAYYQRGLLYYQLKQFDDGLKDMMNARRLDSARFNLLLNANEIKYIDYLRDSEESEKTLFKSYDELFHITQGLACLKNKNFYNAVVYLGEAIRRKDPKTLAASLYLQAKAYYYDQVVVSKRIIRSPGSKPFYVNIIENLANALTLEPNFTEAADLLNSYLLFRVTENDLYLLDGEKLFSAIKLLPKEEQIYLLQNILSKSNDNDKGPKGLLRSYAHKHHLIEKMHAHLIKLDPDNYKNYYNGAKLADAELFAVGNVFYKQGRIKQGESVHAAIKPTAKLDVHYKRGAAYLAQARNEAESYEDMKTDMTAALHHFDHSKSAKAYYQAGIARLFLWDDRAWAHFTKAIAIKPKLAEAYSMRGLFYYTDKQYDYAIEDFKSAIKCYPKFADAHLHLALAYEAKNDKAKAIEYYVKAMQIDKDYTKACSRGEHVSKKQKLKPLFASTAKDFAPHLAEVNQALISPASQLTALFLNIKEGDLKGLSKDKLFSLIKELPADNQIVILEQCFLKNNALGKHFRKTALISPWGIDYMAVIENYLLNLKNTHTMPQQLLGKVQVEPKQVPVEAQAAEVEQSASLEIPQEQSTVLYPVYLQTVVQPQTPSPVVETPPVAMQPAALYPPLYEAPPSAYVPATPTYEQIVPPQTLIPVAIPVSSLYPKLSDEAQLSDAQEFPVVPSAPVFTNNNAVTFFQPPVVTPVVVPELQAVIQPSELYQQQKLRANETLRKYLEEPDAIKEIRRFLETLQSDIKKPKAPWTVKSILGKERPGIPTHIKDLKRLLSEQHSCLSYDSATIWLFNKVLDVFAKLDPNSSYRTDLVKKFDKAKLDDGKRIKDLYKNALQAKANREQSVSVANHEQSVSVPQQTVNSSVLAPVYIATTRKDPIIELNALPPAPTDTPVIYPKVPQHTPTLFNRVKQAFGFKSATTEKAALKV